VKFLEKKVKFKRISVSLSVSFEGVETPVPEFSGILPKFSKYFRQIKTFWGALCTPTPQLLYHWSFEFAKIEPDR